MIEYFKCGFIADTKLIGTPNTIYWTMAILQDWTSNGLGKATNKKLTSSIIQSDRLFI
ncbi:hypothetical protein [Niabella hibiscisoli]|uniref:hypothetical protein n=1 Tax=Niabella hibiscisoli TaxID=1825928 RepID=UPI001F0FB681|nr:hypothetical protein [Niabella hibiscisoli]MCH5718230.1 hypothetical protein [Niabella hibiscisoli]